MMSINTTLFRVDVEDLGRSLAEAHATVEQQAPGSELLLDFSGVRRVDTAAVRALRKVTAAAATRDVKLTARAVPVDVYKVLKLAGLAEGIAFM
jgi:anti-anti-sigma regulatory factor